MINFIIGVIVGAAFIGCWAIYLSRQKAFDEKCYVMYREEDTRVSENMCKEIMKLANDQLAKCEHKNGMPFRRSVVVEYDNLLKIWDIADKLKWRV